MAYRPRKTARVTGSQGDLGAFFLAGKDPLNSRIRLEGPKMLPLNVLAEGCKSSMLGGLASDIKFNRSKTFHN